MKGDKARILKKKVCELLGLIVGTRGRLGLDPRMTDEAQSTLPTKTERHRCRAPHMPSATEIEFQYD